jgi:hypothetical protein
MKPTLFAIATVLPLLAGAIPTAQAVECARGVVRAGCAGPNGAVVAGPRGQRLSERMESTGSPRFDPARPQRVYAATPRPKQWRPGVLS